LRTQKLKKLSGLPKNIYVKGQGGLLDVLYYKEWVYFTYSELVEDDISRTTLAKAQIKNEKLQNLKILLASKSESDETQHYGSRVVIKDDLIYFSVGERKEREQVQDLNFHSGKILRL